MVKCSAYMCDSAKHKKVPGITFHKFPNKTLLRKAWIAQMKIDFNPKSKSVLCSKHFEKHLIEPNSFRSRLLPDAIPTIFESPSDQLPIDMKNYMQYHIMGSVGQVIMKPGVLPTKFECQSNRSKTQFCSTDVPKAIKTDKNKYVKYKLVGGRLKPKKGKVPHKHVKKLLVTDEETITSEPLHATKKPDEVFLDDHGTVVEVPIRFGNDAKVKSEDGICSLCLSCNRHLQPLGDYSEILLKIAKKNTLVLENSNIPALPVCWECVALLRKVIKFQQQVEDAQVSFHLAKLQNKNYPPLSTLTSVVTREEEIDIKIEINSEIDEDVKQNIVIKSEPDFGDTEFLEPESSEKVKSVNDDIQIDIEPDFGDTESTEKVKSENGDTQFDMESDFGDTEFSEKVKRENDDTQFGMEEVFCDTEFLEPEPSDKVKSENETQFDIEPDFGDTEFLQQQSLENNDTTEELKLRNVRLEK